MSLRFLGVHPDPKERVASYLTEQIKGECNSRPEQQAALRLIFEKLVGRPYAA